MPHSQGVPKYKIKTNCPLVISECVTGHSVKLSWSCGAGKPWASLPSTRTLFHWIRLNCQMMRSSATGKSSSERTLGDTSGVALHYLQPQPQPLPLPLSLSLPGSSCTKHSSVHCQGESSWSGSIYWATYKSKAITFLLLTHCVWWPAQGLLVIHPLIIACDMFLNDKPQLCKIDAQQPQLLEHWVNDPHHLQQYSFGLTCQQTHRHTFLCVCDGSDVVEGCVCEVVVVLHTFLCDVMVCLADCNLWW